MPTIFDNVRLPVGLSYGASGGPVFNTAVLTTGDGLEQRNGLWSQGRGKWNIGYTMRTPQQMAELATFFRARKGKFRGFRFKDWTDYSTTFTTGSGVILSATTFQLAKVYTSGTRTETRLIRKPVSGTVSVRRNTVAFTDYTLDYETGIATLTTGNTTAKVYTWQGEFDVPVRFDTDHMKAQSVNVTQLDWSQIPLLEINVGT